MVRIKIFADGADLGQMKEAAKNPLVQGFTTNPTLMKKAGVRDYKEFALRAIQAFPDYPLSLEVFAYDFYAMELQAHKIASWGQNVYVKIPVCNTEGVSSALLISRLVLAGIKVNVTAILSHDQIPEVFGVLGHVPSIVSIFAGRIADTGRNPVDFINHALALKRSPFHEVLWASPRQVLDVYTAEKCGCDIITCTPEIIGKLTLRDKDLSEYSVETVKMFYEDGRGYSL